MGVGGGPDSGQDTATPFGLAPTDSPEPGTFQAIFRALEASSQPLIGPARSRLLVIPIRNDRGVVAGGFWGSTLFEWLRIEMLFVPQPLRGLGVGTALMALAERDARERGCRGAYVDTFSFQAAPFYQKLGFIPFGVLDDFPPGHSRLYFRKHYQAPSSSTGPTKVQTGGEVSNPGGPECRPVGMVSLVMKEKAPYAL